MKGYILSKDYAVLWDLIQKGHRVAGWVDRDSNYDDSKRPSIVEIKLNPIDKRYLIGSIGVGYEGQTQTVEAFSKTCECFNLRFIEPSTNKPKLVPVTTLTCIKEGDQVIITGRALVNEPLKAKIVKVSKSDGVEIIFNKKGNGYFNLGMYLKGESWVKEVYILR